jgi:kynurenine 3-monooxygenase
MRHRRIAVVGGGPTGCLAGILLARAGHDVVLFEQRARAALVEPMAGRSINLALPESTLEAILDLGVDQRLGESSVLLRGRVMHARNGELTTSAYEDRRADPSPSLLHPAEQPFSVSRGVLGRFLLEAAEREVRFSVRFGHRLVEADLEAGQLEFETADGSTTSEADVVVGADGAFSTVRELMAEAARCEVEVRPSGIRYRELPIGSGPGDGGLAPGHFHLWPRRGFMLIALPNRDGFTWTVFSLETGGIDLDVLGDAGARMDLFEREFPDVAGVVDWIPSPASAAAADASHPLVTVRCRPWHRGRAVLAGDACHALLPFSGRGTSEGLADCRVLARCLARKPEADLPEVFEAYSAERKPVADGLVRFSEALAPLLLSFLPEAGPSARI